jgi:two-component system KDP operon response regulator KdpE
MGIDSRPQVLIVDDEPAMGRLVARSLDASGFKTTTVSSGPEAIDRVWEQHHDVILLDLSMPGMDGRQVIRELHGRHPVRIIVMSGQDQPASIGEALDLGADDFLPKPFAVSELAARIRAVLRRQRALLHGQRTIGDAVVDFDAGTITLDGKPVELSRRVWRLLEHLVKLDGAVATHDELLEQAFGPAYVGDAAYLRLWIGQLRRALGVPIWDEGPIRTIPGIGYALDDTGRLPTRRARRPRDEAGAGADR